MSNALLHMWEPDIARYSNNVDEMMRVCEDIYNTAYARGQAHPEVSDSVISHWVHYSGLQRPYCCANCGAFSESMTDICLSCGAEMVYGSSNEESEDNG